jgi:hypothetical protein
MATRRSNPSRRIEQPAVPVGSAPAPRSAGASSSTPSSEAAPPARRATTPPRVQAAPAAAAPIAVSADARRSMIAKAAYLRAERRGFLPGFEEEDWLTAEQEVDARLSAGRGVAQ